MGVYIYQYRPTPVATALPKICNVIPAIIKASATVATFKRRLKSHFWPLTDTIRLCPPPTRDLLDVVYLVN